MSKRTLGTTIAMACLAVVVITAKVEARGGGGGGRGMGGRAFAGGGGGQFRGGDVGRDFGGAGGIDRGDLGGALGGGLDGGDRLNGGLGAGDRLNGGLGALRDGGLAGEGDRPLANGAQGEKQLQQFLGLPADGARGAGDRLDGDRGEGLANRADGDRRDLASQRANELRDNAQGWVNRFDGGNEPFSAGWYADHPNAWQYTHPHADAWAAASLAATTAWIGAAAYDDGGDSTTVINEAPDYEDYDTADSIEAQSPIAANVAGEGQAADGGDWLSLGVYALEPPAGGQKELMQLAVSKAGEIKGVYYNADDNLSENITGQVTKATQQATWNVVSTPELQFSASLQSLTSSTGEVNVATPNGSQQTWMTARLQEPQPNAAATPASPEEVIPTP